MFNIKKFAPILLLMVVAFFAFYTTKNINLQNGTGKNIYQQNTQKITTGNLLALSWHNAFCETHRFKKECKINRAPFLNARYHETHFVLHGLWPQPRDTVYCGVSATNINLDKHHQWNKLPAVDLDDNIKHRLKQVMPGFASGLHRHEWVKHGSCYGVEPNRYFGDAVAMVEKINDSKVGDFFRQHTGKYVTLKQARAVFDRNFGVGAGKRVELRCVKGLISELWLHIGSGSQDVGSLLKQGQQIRSSCQGGIIDKAGF